MNAIRKARESLGLSQEGLAAKAGVSKASVVRLEAGSLGRVDTLRKVAECLGLDVGVLSMSPSVGEDVAAPESP